MNSSKLLGFTALLSLLSACAAGSAGDGSLPEDTSTSGIVGSVVGGAVSATDASGTYAETQKKQRDLFSFISTANASDSRTCPQPPKTSTLGSVNTSSQVGCTASGTSYWLNRSSCSFDKSATVWSGVEAYFLSSGSANCNTFPYPGANGTVVKQYVNAVSSTAPGTMMRTSSSGTVITVDDASTNLSNFNGDTLTVIANGGYGTKTTFDSSGNRTAIQITERTISPGRYDHSMVANLGISEVRGGTQRTLTGSVTVYYNLLKVMGTSTLSNLVQSSTCCVPVGGSITTTYAAGSNLATPPTAVGATIVGKSETLTFNGCGVGSLKNTSGVVKSVSTATCL